MIRQDMFKWATTLSEPDLETLINDLRNELEARRLHPPRSFRMTIQADPTGANPHKINIIKAIRVHTGWNLPDAAKLLQTGGQIEFLARHRDIAELKDLSSCTIEELPDQVPASATI